PCERVARIFEIAGRSVRRWYDLFKSSGHVISGGRVKKKKHDPELVDFISSYVKDHPTFYMEELQCEVNEEGVEFYNNLINELLASGITHLVTLYHLDLPLALQTDAILAPGRKCKLQTEAYLAGHNLLLAHARAVKVYRNKFQAAQKGGIGITLDCKGDHPQVLKDRCGLRLPKFTIEETKLLKGSSDFFGLNHYGTNYTEPRLLETA
ncbi:hypothetical protein JG687_00017664, partial [Phytophthora cactorum]